MKNKIPSFLTLQPSAAPFVNSRGKMKISFLENGINRLAHVIKSAYIQWETSSMEGLLQGTDARVKVIFLISYIVIVSIKRNIMPELLLGGTVFMLVLICRLNIFSFYKKVLILGFFFGFLLALPSAFNVITSGKVVLPLVRFSREYHFWIYKVPDEIGITTEGLNVVAMLTMRVVNSLSLAFLVLYTTSFPDIIKAFKVLRVPDSFLVVITLSYKYIFIFAKTVEDMHLAKKSRMVRPADNDDARRWVAGRIGFIFNKTRARCEEIFKAMLSRGFSEDFKLYGTDKLNFRDKITGCVFFLGGVLFLWM